MDRSAALLLALLVLALADAAKLPSYFSPRCSLADSDETKAKCIMTIANQGGITSLANGDRKLGIPSMRPLVVPSMALAQGTSTVGLNITWEPAEIWGLGESQLYNYKMSYAKKHSEFDVLIPSFVLSGIYSSNGRILLLPIKGHGTSNVTVTNLRAHYSFDWPSVKGADGKDHAKMGNTNINIISADGMYLHFDNLFNGDKALGNTMNAFLNENWRELIKELGPGMSDAVGQVVKLVVQRLTDLVPIDDFWAS